MLQRCFSIFSPLSLALSPLDLLTLQLLKRQRLELLHIKIAIQNMELLVSETWRMLTKSNENIYISHACFMLLFMTVSSVLNGSWSRLVAIIDMISRKRKCWVHPLQEQERQARSRVEAVP